MPLTAVTLVHTDRSGEVLRETNSCFGRRLIADQADGAFDLEASNLVKPLEERTSLGEDFDPPPAGALFPRTPVGFDPLPAV